MTDKKELSGHRHRLRMRFQNVGLDGFADHEIVELLLTFAIPRRDVKPLAKRLLEQHESICGLLDAPWDDLQEAEGMGETSATLIKLVKALGVKYLHEPLTKRDLIDSPQAVFNYLKMKIGRLPKESLVVLYLDKNHRLLKSECFPGTIDRVAVYPLEITESTLRCHASGVIIAHNHPAGTTAPSENDIEITRELNAALTCLNLAFHEHYIIAGKSIINLLGFIENNQQYGALDYFDR